MWIQPQQFKSQKSKLSAYTCWRLHKIHSKVQMPKMSTDSCWCLHKASLICFHSGHCARLYISSGHSQMSYKGILSKKHWKTENNELYSKSQIRFTNPSALARFKLHQHGLFQVVPCEYRRKDLLGRAIFRRVLSDFAHDCNRLRVYGVRISWKQVCMLEVQWSIDSLWRASPVMTNLYPDLPVPYIFGTKLPVANISGN